jgi:uncharacterized protein
MNVYDETLYEQISKDSKWMTIRDSPIHGKGAFASILIPKGTRIVEYIGEHISQEEATRREEMIGNTNATYLFELKDGTCLDGEKMGNDARYINHCCSPNCDTIEVDGHIFIVTTRDIKKGEELFFDYAFAHEEEIENRTVCKCNSPACRGFINVD